VIAVATQPVDPQLRKTGIGMVGDVPWGTHFFMFYETKEDLLDALVPYFKAGLETGELCFWAVSGPLTVKEATNALRKAVPEFDRYLADGSIEIVRGRQFYLSPNAPDLERVMRTWAEKTDSALTRGYAGLRVSGSTAWLERRHWNAFSDYENEVNNFISSWRITVLCTYPMAGSTAAEILDVARTHQFAIARRNNGWEVVETSELKQAKSEIKNLNDELERRVAERTIQLEAVNQALRKEIAERQRAEEDVRRSEDRLRLVIDTLPALVWSKLPDGSADFLNQRFREYTGLSVEEGLGWGWMLNAFHPEDRAEEEWRAAFAAGQPFEKEARLRRADGAYHRFLIRAVPLRDEIENVVKWYGSTTDIEDRKRAEEVLLEAQDKLARVTRIQAMAELAAAVAHEVNQPLTAITTNANFSIRQLNGSTPNLDEIRTAIVEIVDDSTQASSVLSQIRGMLVHRTPRRAPLDINQIIEEVITLLRNELSRNRISLSTDLASDLPRIPGDPVQLQQVLINLVINAIEAMRTSTRLPRKLLIKSVRNTGEVLVQVQDSGPGIEPQVADRIFETFFTTKAEGTGMGLSICRSIVESHGGRLRTVPNSTGALFEFTLPTDGAVGS
jgi:PAS domain S-box-containing protein